MMKLNKHFNRYETFKSHIYINELGDEEWIKERVYKGFIKCKLMHGTVGTIIVPDLIFYQIDENKRFKWIQPLAFRPNRNYYVENEAIANIMIDISAKTTVKIQFKKSDFIRKLSDYSELYECEILSSTDISEHFTGEGYFNDEYVPFIRAYHHTSQRNFVKIQECGYLKNSKWNIGGTKELKNIGYVYFTPLNELKYNSDLEQVAMSRKGFILLSSNDGRIRKVKIYRRFVKHFQKTMAFWLDTQAIAPSHFFKRRDSIGKIFYLVASPFILRVGMEPEKVLKFEGDLIIDSSKKADYIVLGDCDYLDGVIAPYDEENTSFIFKIEKESMNLFDFWKEHANTDQYTNKQVEYQQF